MKTFIGTKMLRAKPMAKLAYVQLRNWELPSNEDPNEEGYLVEYLDGSGANVQGFTGYVSWSPKDVFESAYSEVKGLKDSDPDWARRVRGELALVMNNAIKLGKFLNSDAALALSEEMLQDMSHQLHSMRSYAEALQWRLDRLK